jgi:hypothetical protein
VDVRMITGISNENNWFFFFFLDFGACFISQVGYKVPNYVNLTWADQVARDAFAIASPFCPYSDQGRFEMKATLCATSHHMCTAQTGHVKPCRSMCEQYAMSCGIANETTCFSVSVTKWDLLQIEFSLDSVEFTNTGAVWRCAQLF